jgi:hypothetical protein
MRQGRIREENKGGKLKMKYKIEENITRKGTHGIEEGREEYEERASPSRSLRHDSDSETLLNTDGRVELS